MPRGSCFGFTTPPPMMIGGLIAGLVVLVLIIVFVTRKPAPTDAPTDAPMTTPEQTKLATILATIAQTLAPTGLDYAPDRTKASVLNSDSNRELNSNDPRLNALKSKSGKFTLLLKTDGNLVLYDNSTGKATWETDSAGKGKGPYRLAMQGDGHLNLHDKDVFTIWSSGTAGTPGGPFKLTLQDDGDLVMVDSKTGKTNWTLFVKE